MKNLKTFLGKKLKFFIFILIFSVYFSSAVGLINSGDTPQYFTAEALLHNRNIDMGAFRDDPHFFVWPDYWQKGDQVLAIRGYFLSMIMIPIHVFSSWFQKFFNLDNFPKIIISQDFAYKLSITSLMTLFSVLGLFIIWKLINEIDNPSNRKRRKITQIILNITTIFGLAFGTYIWKYSSYYARHGFTVFLVGLLSYCSWMILKKNDLKLKIKWLLVFALGISLSFGIDKILFITSGLSFLFLLVSAITRKKSLRSCLKLIKKNSQLKILASLTLVIFFINLGLNLYWYNSFLFTKNTHISHLLVQLDKDKLPVSDWISTPLFPTIFYVLFSRSELPEEVFVNYQKLPEAYAVYQSIDWAQRYIFYGLFTISPFLLWSLISLFLVKGKQLKMVLLSYFQFLTAIILSTKTLSFWGGNQYDVRYFYPYMLFLSFPLAIYLKKVANLSRKWHKILLILLFFITIAFSIMMGFLGLINMFKPALTGERRIYIDIYDINLLFKNYSLNDVLDAAFLNRQNWYLAIILSLGSMIIYYLIKGLIRRLKIKVI